jgi:predicted RNase H-like nuclease (RuvC/YqgF family)
LNPERNQALKNIIREKEKEIGVYNAALTELKGDYDKLKKRVFEFEQGDRVEVDQLKDKLKQERAKCQEQKTIIDYLKKI